MAPYRKDVYCEFEFLKKFRSSNGHFSSLKSRDAQEVWGQVANFIQKSHLMLNVDAKSFKNGIRRNDTLDDLFAIWKKSTGGECKLSFVDEHNVEFFEHLIIKPEGLNKAYLLAKQNAICKDWAKKCGVVVLSPTCWQSNEQAKDYTYLFKDSGSAIKKNEEFEWRGVLRSEYNLSNSNAMVVIDNYIHKNISGNLMAIIDKMLPEKLFKETAFHLTIFTEKQKDAQYDKIYHELVEKIKNSRPFLNCIVELYVKNGKGIFHDRTILTNNAKIDSGAGFSLRKEDGRAENSTEIHILHPGIQSCSDSCDSSYIGILSDARKMVRQIEKGCGYGERFPKTGACQNRLIVG